MAPEIIQGRAFGSAADIWSLGCTVLEMLTGSPPWATHPPVTALYIIGKGDEIPLFPENLSQLGIDFLAKAFSRDPRLRPTATHFRNHKWFKSANGRMYLNGDTIPQQFIFDEIAAGPEDGVEETFANREETNSESSFEQGRLQRSPVSKLSFSQQSLPKSLSSSLQNSLPGKNEEPV
jgi:serine/threonine protein kinase